jgi:hypothetical protein
MGIFAGVSLFYVRRRYEIARLLLDNTQVTYWIQPRARTSNLENKALAGRESFRIHLDNGEHLDIDVSDGELDYFKAWMGQQNSHVFWGGQYGVNGSEG